MPDSSVQVTPGIGPAIDTYTIPGGDHRQRVIVENYGGFSGRFSTYRIPGRNNTTGQNLAAIFNAVGSPVNIAVRGVAVDMYQTEVKAITVAPPVIRAVRLTAVPTGGTAGFKIAEDSSHTSAAQVTTYQDAVLEGTLSGTLLGLGSLTVANAPTSTLSQQFASRFVSVGSLTATNVYEPCDRVEMFDGDPITLRPGEGLGIHLGYTTAASNPGTDSWIVTMRWEEIVP